MHILLKNIWGLEFIVFIGLKWLSENDSSTQLLILKFVLKAMIIDNITILIKVLFCISLYLLSWRHGGKMLLIYHLAFHQLHLSTLLGQLAWKMLGQCNMALRSKEVLSWLMQFFMFGRNCTGIALEILILLRYTARSSCYTLFP